MKTTEENNKLIAEFMGGLLPSGVVLFKSGKGVTDFQAVDKFWSESSSCNEYGNYTTPILGRYIYKVEDIPFAESWDWLMPVVEKCFKIKANYGLHKNIEDALIFNSENRIQDVYNAVVKFIEVYNESFKQEAVYSIRDFKNE